MLNKTKVIADIKERMQAAIAAAQDPSQLERALYWAGELAAMGDLLRRILDGEFDA